MPVDGLVEFEHTVFLSSRTYEPRVKRIVKDRLISTPAMGIVVHMLLYLKCTTLFLHLKAYHHVEVHVFIGSLLVIFAIDIILRVVSVLNVVA